MKKAGYAYAYGAGTIINAISTWKGAAFGIDLKTEAEVVLADDGKIIGYIEEGGDTKLIERCVELTLSRFGSKSGAKVATKSQIPIASGLKSSSAAANAAVLALFFVHDGFESPPASGLNRLHLFSNKDNR